MKIIKRVYIRNNKRPWLLTCGLLNYKYSLYKEIYESNLLMRSISDPISTLANYTNYYILCKSLLALINKCKHENYLIPPVDNPEENMNLAKHKWEQKKRKKIVKIIIQISVPVLIISVFCFFLLRSKIINMPYSNDYFSGMNCYEAKEILEELGFENIKLKPKYDISSYQSDLKDLVKNISIDSYKNFKKYDEFSNKLEVIIYYHWFE